MTRYSKLNDMCNLLVSEFKGTGTADWHSTYSYLFETRPIILRSEDGHTIEVVWDAFDGIQDEERAYLIMEAHTAAFGLSAALNLHCVSGHKNRLTTTIGK
jgi:hypothetical protein